MLRLMRERDELGVVADQVGIPTWARSARRRRSGQPRRGPELRGIHHWTDAGVASWYDFAVAIQEEALARRAAAPRQSRSARSEPRSIPRRPGARRSACWTRAATAGPRSGVAAAHWRANLRAVMLRELAGA